MRKNEKASGIFGLQKNEVEVKEIYDIVDYWLENSKILFGLLENVLYLFELCMLFTLISLYVKVLFVSLPRGYHIQVYALNRISN